MTVRIEMGNSARRARLAWRARPGAGQSRVSRQSRPSRVSRASAVAI